MKLQDYLTLNDLTQTAFANIVSDVINARRAAGLAPNAVEPCVRLAKQQIQRYCAGTVRPAGDEIMGAIYLATSGAVCPNDFYDLPELETQEEVAA